LGIIFLGARFIISPQTGATGYSIPLSNHNELAYGAIKGIRDIFSGIVLLPFLWLKQVRATAIILAAVTIVPLTDFFIVYIHNGTGDVAHLMIHGFTALYLTILSAHLFRLNSKNENQ